jgi:peptide deformylase
MMDILPLSSWKNQDLYTPTEQFNFQKPQRDPIELFKLMKEHLTFYKGLGLSANQIGIPLSVFVFGNGVDPDSIIAAFNPKIVSTSEDTMAMGESCLSFPGLFVKVPRYLQIRCRYTNEHGVTNTVKFENLTARVFQHESDHLEGKTIIRFASRLNLDIQTKKLKKHKNYCIYETGKLLALNRMMNDSESPRNSRY